MAHESRSTQATALDRNDLLSGRLVCVARVRGRDSQTIVLTSRPAGRPALSPLERQVLEWVARGDSLKVAAIELDVPESTARSHFVRARRKLGFVDRQELIFWSMSLAGGSVDVEHDDHGLRLRAAVASVGAAFSEAEQHISALVSCGFSNAAIARARGVSPKTIQNQLLVVFRKLRVSSRFELAQRCTSTAASRRLVAD